MILESLTKLTLGTGGVSQAGSKEQVAVIRRGMEARVWMHCANYNGGVFPNLRTAFKEAPREIPRTIFKVDGITAAGFETTLHDFLAEAGLERTEVAQVCGFPLSQEPDAVLAAMSKARAAGKADAFIMEVMPSYCAQTPSYIRNKLFDGYVFYCNVWECNADDTVLDLLAANQVPILPMRTFAKGAMFAPDRTEHHRQLDVLYARSGCASWVDFCVRFALGLPQARTTIGGTSQVGHLNELLRAVETCKPLDPAIMHDIRQLQVRGG